MTAYRALEMYCQITHDVWTVEAGSLAGGPTGGKVLIMTQKQWIARQMDRPIKISRGTVRAIVARSSLAVWSDSALRREASRLRATVGV